MGTRMGVLPLSPTDGFELTPAILCKIAEIGSANIEGVTLTFGWGDAEVILWANNTDIPCPKCGKECRKCVVMKTDTGDVYVCLHCNEYIRKSDEDDDEYDEYDEEDDLEE